jgi:hypothetical protein
VRSANVNGEVDGLASLVRVDVVLVVGVLVALAEPDIAFCGVVVALGGGDLELALDVAVVVRQLVDLDLVTAGSLHGGTGHTCSRACNETVAIDQGDETGESRDGSVLLHFGRSIEDRRRNGNR